jgi:hypothetical protein
MIKFEYKEDKGKEKLIFDMVEVDQFFIDKDGWLCQKYSDLQYFAIACSEGTPSAQHYHIDRYTEIKKILPEVKRITWD